MKKMFVCIFTLCDKYKQEIFSEMSCLKISVVKMSSVKMSGVKMSIMITSGQKMSSLNCPV